MAEEKQFSNCAIFTAEANNRQPPHGTTANSISANDGSQYSAPFPENRRNDSEGQNQHHHSQQEQQDNNQEWHIQSITITEKLNTQLQRWVYETSDTELTIMERFEKQRWENNIKVTGHQSRGNKPE